MKYLMLHEAFKSDILSKILKFLKGIKNSNEFIQHLKEVMDKLDIPINEIKNEDVLYLNKHKALQIKNEGDNDVYCLKFWFSLDKGYIGYTGVGNKTVDFIIEIHPNLSYFDEYDLDCIRNELRIETGTLIPVIDYNNLKTGMSVIGRIGGDLAEGKIWRSRDDIWIAQNVKSGNTPLGRDWPQGYRYSWSLGSVRYPLTDHSKLCFYNPSDHPLKLELPYLDSVFNFNLPLNRDIKLVNWTNTNRSSISDYKSINNADFGVVIIINKNLPSVKDKKAERVKSKKDALKLMNDDVVRGINISKYINHLIDTMGINIKLSDLEKFQHLEKYLIKNLCGNFSFFSIYEKNPTINYSNNLIHHIYHLIMRDNKEYYLDNIIKSYEQLHAYSNSYYISYTKSINIINEEGSDQLKEIINNLFNAGTKIKNYLQSHNIKTIIGFRILISKISVISNMIVYPELYFSDELRTILLSMSNPSSIKDKCELYADTDFSADIKKIDYIIKHIDSDFKI